MIVLFAPVTIHVPILVTESPHALVLALALLAVPELLLLFLLLLLALRLLLWPVVFQLTC